MADTTDAAHAALQAAYDKVAAAKRTGSQDAFNAANKEAADAQQRYYDAQKAASAAPTNAQTGASPASPSLGSIFGFGR